MSAKDGANLSLVRDAISYNGWPPTTLPEPIKRARDQAICGFAGEGNVAERSERMRAQRSPTSHRISKRGARVGLLYEVASLFIG